MSVFMVRTRTASTVSDPFSSRTLSVEFLREVRDRSEGWRLGNQVARLRRPGEALGPWLVMMGFLREASNARLLIGALQ